MERIEEDIRVMEHKKPHTHLEAVKEPSDKPSRKRTTVNAEQRSQRTAWLDTATKTVIATATVTIFFGNGMKKEDSNSICAVVYVAAHSLKMKHNTQCHYNNYNNRFPHVNGKTGGNDDTPSLRTNKVYKIVAIP